MIKHLVRRVRNAFRKQYRIMQVRGKTKYFCIGRNKTGTTSLKKAFEDLGFVTGDQRAAEILYDEHYFREEFQPIVDYCKTAQVFQDVPFSCPGTFKHLDAAYPGSKFILTLRDSDEQWYESITKFHSKIFGGGRIPTADDLRNASYVRTGWAYNAVRMHGTPEDDPYNKRIMTGHYNQHNASVIEYFGDRPNDLLVVNLGEPGAYQRFVEFIGVSSPFSDFPWENRT